MTDEERAELAARTVVEVDSYNDRFPPMSGEEFFRLTTPEQRNRWRGWIDGLTNPSGKGLRVTPDDPTDYVQGLTAGASAYWTAYNEELKRWDGPF